jgi:hypothetical protein
MAPNTNFTQILATTLKYYAPTLVDNLPKKSPVLSRMKEKDNITVDGGATIVLPLEYAYNAAVQAFDGADTLNVSDNDIITAAEYDWKFYNVPITITDVEIAKNSGKHQVIKLMESKAKNADRSLQNTLSTDLHADGTGFAGKSMLGLKALVDITPATGTVGGINAATAGNEFWRNLELTGVAWGASDAGTNQIDALYTDLRAEGADTDLIVMGKTAFKNLRKELRDNETHMNVGGKKKIPGFGYVDFTMNNADVVYDRYCPDGYCYLLTTEFLKLYILSKMNFSVVPAMRPHNQAIQVSHIRVGLQFCASNRRTQGIIDGIS